MSAKDAFFKLWDGLGALTTKSDGATRLAVYNSVYEKAKIYESINDAFEVFEKNKLEVRDAF